MPRRVDRRRFITDSATSAGLPLLPVLAATEQGGRPPRPAAASQPPPSAAVRKKLFPAFTDRTIAVSGAKIRTLTAGDGPPLLLLHGHPHSHVVWNKVAPALARRFTVVLADLRGYGDSSKPQGGKRHVNYAPRAMAADQIEVMRELGFKRFGVAGHDRGGRVAHRMALDHPQAVEKLAVLDIAPTLTMYNASNKEFATRYFWWFFLIQPFPLPEHLIGLDPEFYLRAHLDHQNKTPGAVTPAALAEYARCYCNTPSIHAACEDYRAAASVGLEQDEADERAKKKVTAPVLALWGAKGTVGALYDVLATWRAKAGDVRGRALDCGHSLPEERPDELVRELTEFFGKK
jgi:haloacetate dehalogenase